MTGRIFLIIFILLFHITIARAEAVVIEGNSDSTLNNLIQLRELYSVNKIIPSEFEKEILISLSHYPELSKVHITFCYGSIFTSMKAVPSIGFLFQKHKNRTYRIVMNNRTCTGRNMMQRISTEALTGVLGHELGHIEDYCGLSNFALLKLIIKYTSRKGRIDTEVRADQIAVNHNLGNELLEFTETIYRDSCMNPEYIRYKKKYYNSPSTLSKLVIRYKETPLVNICPGHR